jgi:hypothetical protein
MKPIRRRNPGAVEGVRDERRVTLECAVRSDRLVAVRQSSDRPDGDEDRRFEAFLAVMLGRGVCHDGGLAEELAADVGLFAVTLCGRPH